MCVNARLNIIFVLRDLECEIMARVAFIPINAVGHLKPMISIALAATRIHTYNVKVFADQRLCNSFKSLALDFQAISSSIEEETAGDLVQKSLIRPLDFIEDAVNAVKSFRPDYIVFDPFSILGAISSRVCNSKSISLVSMAGYGALGDKFFDQFKWNKQNMLEANYSYYQKFGVNLKMEGMLPVLFPDADSTFITNIPELSFQISNTSRSKCAKLIKDLKSIHFVGHCGLEKEYMYRILRTTSSHYLTKQDNIYSQLTYHKLLGAKVIFFSLGTIVTSFRSNSPFGGAPSGIKFLSCMLSLTIHALLELSYKYKFVLVASVGNMVELEMVNRLQRKFSSTSLKIILRSSVDQIKILKRFADIFVTHHGANSQLESIMYTCPMISLPGVGDQILNAKLTNSLKVACSFWSLDSPYTTCNSQLMSRAIEVCLKSNEIKNSLQALKHKISAYDGEKYAAKLIESI